MIKKVLYVLVFLLFTSCSITKPPQDKEITKISCNLFYEYYDLFGYKVKNFKIENRVVSNNEVKWERGFSKSVPVEPAEELAKKLGFSNYIDLQLAHGQLYHYENSPVGKIFVFFGNYNSTNEYTLMIWDDDDVHKINIPNSDHFFRDLQMDNKYLYLILSEYSDESFVVYEIELNDFKLAQYTLPYEEEMLDLCGFLVKNRKLYMIGYTNLTDSYSDAFLRSIDLLTNKCELIERKGYSAEAIFSTDHNVVVIYGKMINGFTSLPPYLEYYDESLNVMDSKTLSINDDNYHIYLSYYFFYDDKLYFILHNRESRDCLYVEYDLTSNICVYSAEIAPPKERAIMQDATFYIKENEECYTIF